MNGVGITGVYPAAFLSARVSGNHDQGRPVGRFYRYGYAPAWARANLRHLIDSGESQNRVAVEGSRPGLDDVA